MISRGTIGQLLMDEQQELLQQRTPLLPTGIPNGLNEALRSIWYGWQTRQVQQRVGHEDQTPMFPNGFGTPHAVLVEAQVPLTVLIKRLHLPDIMPPKVEAFTRCISRPRADVRPLSIMRAHSGFLCSSLALSIAKKPLQ